MYGECRVTILYRRYRPGYKQWLSAPIKSDKNSYAKPKFLIIIINYRRDVRGGGMAAREHRNAIVTSVSYTRSRCTYNREISTSILTKMVEQQGLSPGLTFQGLGTSLFVF